MEGVLAIGRELDEGIDSVIPAEPPDRIKKIKPSETRPVLMLLGYLSYLQD
jgi:hypothetical protein